MPKIYKFYELFSQWNTTPRNLLLGNGFSIACYEGFAYNNLYEKIPPYLKKYFDSDSCDFEKAQKNAKYIADQYEYCIDPMLGSMLREDISEIQDALSQTISITHPRCYEIAQSQKVNTLNFLVKFNNIFTLNYDLLLYWLIIFHKNLNHNRYSKYDDGFRRPNKFDCIWENPYYRQNVFYLHGGLHLFANTYNTYKIKSDEHIPLISISQELQKINNKPLIVTEKDSECKYQLIQRNNYLSFCYNQLAIISGYLVIYGHSLDKKDNHIFRAINNNYQIKKVFISVYREDENVIENAFKAFPNKEIIFYDAESVNLWK